MTRRELFGRLFGAAVVTALDPQGLLDAAVTVPARLNPPVGYQFLTSLYGLQQLAMNSVCFALELRPNGERYVDCVVNGSWVGHCVHYELMVPPISSLLALGEYPDHHEVFQYPPDLRFTIAQSGIHCRVRCKCIDPVTILGTGYNSRAVLGRGVIREFSVLDHPFPESRPLAPR